jgi:hypothetical protein
MVEQSDFANFQSTPIAGPVVTRERFAQMVGLPLGVITGWCNKGLLPCVSIGKYSLVNVSLLANRCVAKEFN